MKLRKITLIGLLTLILLVSVSLSRSNILSLIGTIAILIPPILISLMAGLIVFTDNGFSIIVKSILTYLFIGLNDIGIKLFAAGIHDTEGLGWTNLMFVVGSVPAVIILFIGVLRGNKEATWIKVAAILIFILLIYVHLQVFQSLGVKAN